jgi:3-hydroxyisobutyrate dehydrogenase-like beta-hydroxyacid dehydrogenase
MHRAIGLIGLGLMGNALARRFIAAGRAVVGYDVAQTARDAAREAGASVVESAGEVFAQSELIVLSLPTSEIAESVLRESERSIRRDAIIIDTTTGDPDDMAKLGARLAQAGVHYLDATVAGNSAEVLKGDVTVLAGGDPGAFRAIEPLLATFAKRSFHLGPCGHGARMKLVVNLMLGLSRAVLAEALTLAGKTGLDRRVALEVLKASNAYSRVMDAKGEKMLTGDFTPVARLSQHLKDVRLMLEAAGRVGANLPLSEAHRALLEACERAGYGQLDNAAVIKAFDF